MHPAAVVLGLGLNGLGVARSLGHRHIPVIGVYTKGEEVGRHSIYCQPALLPSLGQNPRGFKDGVLALGAAHSERPVILATTDAYVSFLSSERATLRTRFRFKIPEEKTLHALMDKDEVLRVAQANGLAAPMSFYFPTTAAFLAAGKELPIPCLVKPRHSGNKAAVMVCKARRLGSREAVRAFANTHPELIPHVVFQEIIEGPDSAHYFCCLYMNETHEVVASFTGRKIRQYPPGFGVAASCKAVRVPALIEQSERLLRAAGYVGLAELEFKWDGKTGRWKLIEVNTRSWTHNSLAAACGTDLIFAAYCDAIDEKPPGTNEPQQQASRFWVNVELEIGTFWRTIKRGQVPSFPWQAFSWRTCYAYFAWDDPKPALWKMHGRWAHLIWGIINRPMGNRQDRSISEESHHGDKA